MEPLKWKQRHGQLADALAVEPERLAFIQKMANFQIKAKTPIAELIDTMRAFCKSDEEYTAFIFALGYADGFDRGYNG